ncbi:uncharacterized protein F4812DRAFT_459837 [Daldinia caldariorum]|uniref:uncharacterized protein n=1 Tax=Daldinia caldariorum TaxID=326644 RepID=UPI0020078D18|nr:uncharacterized protein F4812DRAFT_459837 [Daldinia caldariorum]KAI1467736.1 hypothetical protein F4812DRAFT_459837 [Daldinia caldariorum]
MAIDVEELFIQPFREVVERGKEAVANAETAAGSGKDEDDADPSSEQDVADMLKAARSLVKEGERALQRLLPLWQERVDKHGDAFREAMRQNDRILDNQRRLEDLLYDLDDFVQVDSFDPNRFADVQASSKAFALALMEAIKRIHIEESVPPVPPLLPWTRPLPSQGLNNKGRGNGGSSAPMRFGEDAGISGASTPSRRPSSPDILGAERDFISLVSDPPSAPPPNSRTSAWVNEQTTAAKSWSRNNSIPEDDCFVGQPVIFNSLDGLALHGQELAIPSNIPRSPDTSYSRISWYTTTGSYMSGPRSSIHIPTSDQRTTSLAKSIANPHETREPIEVDIPPLPNPPDYEDGLIPADELFASRKDSFSGYQIGLDSSLYIYKGLCTGSQTYRVKGRKSATKAVMEYGTRRSIARCTECEFAQNLLEVELDDALDPSANFSKAGVLYRLRFLYKSHLVSTSAFTMQFGCLFCAEKGHTVYADDATIFTTQDQLFKHLSRHPQPLPEIPGITVLYGEVPKNDPSVEDYDLHFPNPPVASLLPNTATLAKLPSARAVKSHIKRYGRDLTDPDGSSDQVLKFMEGARIVGLKFPEKWKGKWCTGWHDGRWGSFPTKHVVLESPANPPSANTCIEGMFVTTRWKWEVKDHSTGWISFDKDETLSNVCWLNHDDWCWYGTKKNGKGGLFPRSYIRLESLRGDAIQKEEDDDSVSKARKQGSFGLPTIKMRRMTIGSGTS